ncbi:hypothetical protein [Streptomyces botrytidirepellens]|uniref:Uncharacterized protein n=1 Tax=Streptomyces botrytidirepellens TaxID=2486417 RepID=A0A3M8WY45_9ACTN|nr:hypothetical protein [Streptomyces botrytidirepellens]RNG34059.1 hypothetical protein EEJ42_06765 [Streptomyces botrytidirepellens]
MPAERPGVAPLADVRALRQATAHWSLEELTTAARVLTAESIRRRESQLVDVLRALFFVHPDQATPVTRVEFTTAPADKDSVLWDASHVYLHHEDGSAWPF